MIDGLPEKEKIVEIAVRKTTDLSEAAQSEVNIKLQAVRDGFNYKGYAKVVYVESSPTRIKSVDPIEGTILDYSRQFRENPKKEE
jgi:glycine cleavage system H lipoate-binding protein